MSKYEELVAWSQAWVNCQDRAKSDLEAVIRSFVKHCEIPDDKVRYLPWEDTNQVYTAGSGDTFSFNQACHFHRETCEWGVGVSISLGRPSTGHYAKVGFTVRLKAVDEDKSILTFAALAPQTLNLKRNGWGDNLFPAAIESLKNSFVASSAKSPIGFNISLSSDQEITP